MRRTIRNDGLPNFGGLSLLGDVGVKQFGAFSGDLGGIFASFISLGDP